MDIHKNARLTPHGRERLAKMIVSGQTPQAASEAVGVCPCTGRKWADRFRQEGLAGLQDRSSRECQFSCVRAFHGRLSSTECRRQTLGKEDGELRVGGSPLD